MIEQLTVQYLPGDTVYFCVVDSSGNYRDFADNTFKPIHSYAVAGVNMAGAGSGWFKVATDVTALLTAGKKIRVRGSTGNDGVYTILAGSSYSAPNTTINVAEAVPNATADGTLDLNATPAIVATELNVGGTQAKSLYQASVDLAALYQAGLAAEYQVLSFVRAGSFAIPASDALAVYPGSLEVQFGEKGRGVLDLEVNAAFTTTAGTEVRLTAVLTRNGVRVPLETYDAAATLALAVREWGAAVDLFTVAATTFNSTNLDFELNDVNPSYVADRVYKYVFTLVENGNTWVFEKIMPNHG